MTALKYPFGLVLCSFLNITAEYRLMPARRAVPPAVWAKKPGYWYTPGG